MTDRKQPQPGSGSDQQNQSGGQEESSKQRQNPSAIEWVVGGIATLLVLTGIGFLIYEGWRGTSSPPFLSVRAQEITPQPAGGYVVEIVAENRGGTTARGLTVEGKLLEKDQGSSGGQQGGREVEKATTTLSWVPAHAEREGGLFFNHDPRHYQLEITPKGYDRP